ncbi:hypothetical protein [Dendronalium sp. ChiSLP03b]|uniref:hypothetical protein n=1 Tax=Dendronalium sp. ChiSLP03b TaxID=3075381 RepID=UPI002AD5411A|nr:hypothetical protein [Dendronalium sp. ChiSLP03b]MDZ8205489.1 hypothetical protein [Dendronalium sp. ChiSLP03b]
MSNDKPFEFGSDTRSLLASPLGRGLANATDETVLVCDCLTAKRLRTQPLRQKIAA